MLYLRMDINYEECVKEGKEEVERCHVLEIWVGDVEYHVLREGTEPQKVERGRVLRNERKGEARRASPQNNDRLRNRGYGL